MQQEPGLPSGYESSGMLPEQAVIDGSVLPWLHEPVQVGLAECTLQGGERFLLASVIATHPKLTEAAKGMTEGQRRNTDNMFYSRLPPIISQGHSPSVETLPSPSTPYPIYVLRNYGGQRVYFARTQVATSNGHDPEQVVLRLAACDKNRQALVMSVLSGLSDRHSRQRRS